MDREFYKDIPLLKKFVLKNGIFANVYAEAINEMPIHIHDGVELVYVIEGSVRVKISFNSYELQAGEFLVINTFEMHKIEKSSTTAIVLFLELDESAFDIKDLIFAFDPRFYRELNLQKVELVKINMVKLYLDWNQNQRNPEELEIAQHIADICRGNFQMQNFDPINHIESLLADSIVKLDRIGNTVKFFYQKHENKIKLNEVAEREFIDKFYAAHMIKEGTGSTFQELLNIVRIDRSEVLLLGTDLPISRIAEGIGFSSSQYFVQCFKKYYHTTPYLYRKIYEKEVYPKKEMLFDKGVFKEEELKSKLADLFDLPRKHEVVLFSDDRKNQMIEILKRSGFFEEEESVLAEEIQSISFKKTK